MLCIEATLTGHVAQATITASIASATIMAGIDAGATLSATPLTADFILSCPIEFITSCFSLGGWDDDLGWDNAKGWKD